MRVLLIITIAFVASVCISCTSSAHLEGTYAKGYYGISAIGFKFMKPDKFEYYTEAEGNISTFSSGTWTKDKKTVFLNGFSAENLHVLKIESKVEANADQNQNRIMVRYTDDPLEQFTRVDVLVNDNYRIRISGDTSFFINGAIKKVQVIAFLSYGEFLPRGQPRIDTLRSPQIVVSAPDRGQRISLGVDIEHRDFFRISFKDTVVIKNRHTLLRHNIKLKRIKE